MLLLAAGGGVCLVLGVRHVVLGARLTGERVNRLLAVACFAATGNVLTAIGVYRSVSVDAYVSAVRIHAVFTLVALLSVVWFVAVYTRVGPRWLLWIATAVTVSLVAWNLASPVTIYFSTVLDLQGVLLPWGEVIVQATAVPHRWTFMMAAVAHAFSGFWVYAWWRQMNRGEEKVSRPLAVALSVLLATVLVEALDPSAVTTLPVDELGFVGFVAVMSLGLWRGGS